MQLVDSDPTVPNAKENFQKALPSLQAQQESLMIIMKMVIGSRWFPSHRRVKKKKKLKMRRRSKKKKRDKILYRYLERKKFQKKKSHKGEILLQSIELKK